LSDQLQKCKSIDDVISAFVNVGFKLAHEIDPKRKALSITPSGGDFLNIVLVDTPPSSLQTPEKRAGVRAALYVSDDFRQYKFFLTKLISGKEPSYSFTTSVLKSPTQLGNLARVKINGLKFNKLESTEKVIETSSEQAIHNFEENLGVVVKSLRNEIMDKLAKDHMLNNEMKKITRVFSIFIGPEFKYKALIELLIQHLLTKDIFAAAYGRTFQRGNVVASSLENLAKRFSDIPTLVNDKHELRERRDAIVHVIELQSIQGRLEIIKLVYEAFYTVYNPRDADRLGIVYTPKVAVDFIIRSIDKLMSKHLQANISDKNTHVIDPCIGTGTFMISLLNYMDQELHVDKKSLFSKYMSELHANEVSILAYYIAAMNVERTVASIIGKSIAFPGIVWRDTLLTLSLDDFPMQGNANVARMNSQQKRKITVILGNPPYNAGQKNFGDGNPNPDYFSNGVGVDDRITETYVKESKFKTQRRDMYKRFVRWASDRIGQRGIIGFISNNSFLNANSYDGMRKCLMDEFDHIYVCNLRGNARLSGEAWREEGEKFFGRKSRVGVAIYFLIKTGSHTKAPAKIHYASVGDYKSRVQKIEWINGKTIIDMNFRIIEPSDTWPGKKKQPEYTKFVPLMSFKSQKQTTQDHDAVFQMFTNGVLTGADDWQTDFDQSTLVKKIKLYAKEYNLIRNKLRTVKKDLKSDTLCRWIEKSSISWYGDLDTKAKQDKPMVMSSKKVYPVLYRPFVEKYFHYDSVYLQRSYKWPHVFKPNDGLSTPTICVSARSPAKFACIGALGFVDRSVISSSQNVPLYKLDEKGNLVSNVTQFGRKLFQNHYSCNNITDSDIFYYCYAVLNDPAYADRYGEETRTLHPRIPLHPDFDKWTDKGKQLFMLHSNYKTQTPYKLLSIAEGGDKSKFILNLAPSTLGMWKARIDGSLSIDGIPAIAADPKSGGYVVGSRTPIGWVLEYYQKACKIASKSKVPKRLASIDFMSHKEEIIELIYKLCTVSVETVRIQNEILNLPHSFIVCEKSCCHSLSIKIPSTGKTCTKKRKRAIQNAGQKKL